MYSLTIGFNLAQLLKHSIVAYNAVQVRQKSFISLKKMKKNRALRKNESNLCSGIKEKQNF